ncbi:PEP-CTERM sorting domain-containing protein [Colwellia psychrerythraea]|uniref:PEP motif anchor domain protein n=1 Tax=Colwellia psychrerythraea TaxID=28229 RepID=A0A099KHW4_COLPS|nr:PEP-CTERM sorting domain-containing protein [Colwellia psychrerythraea]KGJ89178.1 hypothetical protein GAB14E_4174 [Colwellia psychrerythraea]
MNIKFNFLKALIPLVLCFGFITNAQAGLITNYDLADVNSGVSSNSVKDWFSLEISNEFDFFTLSFNWKDQGWGNRKGKLFYNLSDTGWISFGLLAEHVFTEQMVTITRSQLASFTQAATLNFGYRVGGGGGHRLQVNNATLAVTNIPTPTTLTIFALALLGLASRRLNNL